MKKLPDYGLLATTYMGKGWSPEAVKKTIGGAINEKDVTNTCIVRLSKPLNDLGHPIPAWTEKFRTRKGSDRRWYGLRVTEFWDYMIKTYGKPVVHQRAPINRKAFETYPGIIGFLAKFKDSNGHFTLWDGYDLVYGGEDHDYWKISSEAALWHAGETRVFQPEV
jgi:hypothetical protein